MPLTTLSDSQLIQQIQNLIREERRLLTQILHHLQEIEKRRLYSDFGCRSLFDYATKELGYSESAAYRRIQAMRLLKEMPEVEAKVATGSLSLSNITQAVSFFREKPEASKLEVLQKLENKSARQGQKLLLSLQPEKPLPAERSRQITTTHKEVSFVMSEELEIQLENLRALLGNKGAEMSLADLIAYMAKRTIAVVQKEKWGHRRSTSAKPCGKNPRAISKATRRQVWQKAGHECTICKSKHRLQIDHIQPVAFGGSSSLENLRLLCFHCNQRQAIKVFGERRGSHLEQPNQGPP